MVSTYKNPTRIVRKVEEVSTAWERIAPKVEFGGMNLADFNPNPAIELKLLP